MTCKDCLHYPACAAMFKRAWGELPETEEGAERCETFIDRTKYTVREKGEWEEGEWTGEVRCYYWNRDYGNRSHLCEHTPLNCGTCHMNEVKNKRAKKCSVCGKQQMRKTDFCPNCGADMRKGITDD